MKKYLSALLILFTILSFTPLFASAAGRIDTSRCGSISITVKSPDKKKPLKGIKFNFYRVGDVSQINNKFTYTLADGYKDSGASLAVNDENEFKKETAEILADFVSKKGIKGVSSKTNNQGKAFVGNCRTGLYLVVADAMPADIPYGQIAPFLISLPAVTDTLEYSVNAAPKVPLSQGGNRPTTTTVSTTKPSNSSNTTKPDGTNGRHNSTTPSKPSQLPNTGMLKWPVPVMAVAGPVIFAFGYLDVMGRKKRNEK